MSLERKSLKIFLLFSLVIHYGHCIGCYHCISTSMHNNEECEKGKRSAHYYDQCIPEGEPSNSLNGQIYCSKVIGSGYGDMGDRVVVRGCTYYPRNECRESISVRGRTIRGCIYTCTGNYCNSSHKVTTSLSTFSMYLYTFTLTFILFSAFFGEKALFFL